MGWDVSVRSHLGSVWPYYSHRLTNVSGKCSAKSKINWSRTTKIRWRRARPEAILYASTAYIPLRSHCLISIYYRIRYKQWLLKRRSPLFVSHHVRPKTRCFASETSIFLFSIPEVRIRYVRTVLPLRACHPGNPSEHHFALP